MTVDGTSAWAGDDEHLAALLARAEELLDTGEHADGCDQARQAASLAEQLGADAAQARALWLMETHDYRLGEYEQSLAAGHRALGLYSRLGDLPGLSAALNGMVLAYYELGLPDEALDHARRSLEAAKQSADPLVLAWAYNRAGLGHAGVGNHAEGIVSMEFALSLAREIGDGKAIFAALNNLTEDLNSYARELRTQGAESDAAMRVARALELSDEALGFARASGNPYEVAIILVAHAQSLVLAREWERAHAALEESLALSREGGYRAVVLAARYEQARLELDRGELARAVALYQELREGADPARDSRLLLEVHLALWRAHKELEQYREALEHYERYHELERRQQSEMAKTRARVLSRHLDLDRAHVEARRATREAEVERSRTRELEAQASALREERELLSRRVDQDGLTGLWNRRHVEQELPRLIREAGVRGEPVGVVFVDADHFKDVNDRYGHLVGDDVLRRLADLLRANVRPTDVVARIGGEEFVVLLPGASADDAVALSHRLCEAVRDADWQDLTPGCSPTVSAGVAARVPRLNEVQREVAELLGRADEALYEAKRAGRDRVVLAD